MSHVHLRNAYCEWGIEIYYYCVAFYFSFHLCPCLLHIFGCINVGCICIYNCYSVLTSFPFSQRSFFKNLISDSIKCSRLILHFPLLNPEINHFSQKSVPFIREWYLEIKMLVLEVFTINQTKLPGIQFQADKTKTYMYIYQHMHTNMSIFMFTSNYLYIKKPWDHTDSSDSNSNHGRREG